MSKNGIYVDYQATTPVDERVFEAMKPYFMEIFGNPASNTHRFGFEAKNAVEKAREQIAKVINAKPSEIIFTSGATESNNLALKGLYEFYGQSGKNHIITTKIEHKCVLMTAKYLSTIGCEVTFLDVDENGLVRIEDLKSAIKDNTLLVSIIGAHNEIGVIQNLKEIGHTCREAGVFFHSDCAQAFGKIDLDVKDMCIDLLSISGHKIYGPKGIGALYVGKNPRVQLLPQIHGGGQERGFRSGTLASPLIVGLGVAAEIADKDRASDSERLTKMRDYIIERLESSLEKVKLNGHRTQRLPNNINICFAGVEGEGLILKFFNDIALSSGSACTSESLESSYVLKALGVPDVLAHSSLRIGLGRFTKKEEVDEVIERIIKAVNEMREISPIWEMIKKGVDMKSFKWDEQ